MSGGRKSKQDPGTERVLFNATKDANGDAVTVYCGIVTHYSQNKINDLDPFRNCGRGSTSTVSSFPESTQFSTRHSMQQQTTLVNSQQHTTVQQQTTHSTSEPHTTLQQQTTHSASEPHTTLQQQTTPHPTSYQPQETESPEDNPDGSEGNGGIPFPGGFPLPGGAGPGAAPGAFGNTVSQVAVSTATIIGSQPQITQNTNEPGSTAPAQTNQVISDGPMDQLSETHPTIIPMIQTTGTGGQINSQVSEPPDTHPTGSPIVQTTATAAAQTTQAGGDLSFSVDESPSTYPTQNIPLFSPTETFPVTETPLPIATSPIETSPPASLSQPNPANATSTNPSNVTKADEPPL